MLYELENEFIKIVVSDFGATLFKFIDKKNNRDIVLGFDSEKEYLDKWGTYFGASVGRNANRIGNAEITINNVKYKLTVNDHNNQLHGGIHNFSNSIWKVKERKNDYIVFALHSNALEEGFPGNLDVEVTYRLDSNNLIWEYSGIADEDTILNMTNHSYFNLGDENILNHNLKIYTNLYSPTDKDSLTLDYTEDVCDTPYDFTESKAIKENLSRLEKGIDNNYSFEKMGDKLLAELSLNSRTLKVHSDLPDMHVYTAGWINNLEGKNNTIYNEACGICFEAQFYPNGINYESFIKPIIKKDEKVRHYIRYELV